MVSQRSPGKRAHPRLFAKGSGCGLRCRPGSVTDLPLAGLPLHDGMNQSTPPDSARGKRKWVGAACIALLCMLAVGRSWWGTRLDTFTVDEPWHVVAGASYLRDNDFRLNPEHPPLVKLAAASALRSDFKLPTVMAPSEKTQERDLVERVMYADNDAALVQARARIALWTLNGALLFAIGLLLWRAFGLAWALGTLGFLALEPSIGAHLPVVMTDLPLALTLALAALACGLTAGTWQWRWVAASGVAVGLALASKHSAVAGLAGLALLLLVAALLGWRSVGVRVVVRRLVQVAAIGVVALTLLWATYGLHFHTGTDGSDHFNRAMSDKVADLHLPLWREGLTVADRLHLAPRAYLWGLADTVRSGVEGRGVAEQLLWGRRHAGSPPWFTWPSIVLGKVPLPLLALSLLGLVALRFVPAPPAVRWTLAAVAAMGVAHLLALAASEGAYGGIRHALPVVMVLAVVSGAVWAVAQRHAIAMRVAGAGLLALTLAMTLHEPRLWEYHNELAGGTRGAWRNFGNEGVDLGQRFGELQAYYRRVIAPSGEPLYINTWLPDTQLHEGGLPYGRYAEDLNDRNVAGDYAGYFVYDTGDRLPRPIVGWDPGVAMRDLKVVARMGNIEVWHGVQHMPLIRAYSLQNRVTEYIYRDGGTDWALVEKRLSEVVPVIPFHVGAGIELGNARLRLGDRAGARAAYEDLLSGARDSLDGLTRADLRRQVAQLSGSTPLASIKLLRNPWME
jgi:hypothetical protein